MGLMILAPSGNWSKGSSWLRQCPDWLLFTAQLCWVHAAWNKFPRIIFRFHYREGNRNRWVENHDTQPRLWFLSLKWSSFGLEILLRFLVFIYSLSFSRTRCLKQNKLIAIKYKSSSMKYESELIEFLPFHRKNNNLKRPLCTCIIRTLHYTYALLILDPWLYIFIPSPTTANSRHESSCRCVLWTLWFVCSPETVRLCGLLSKPIKTKELANKASELHGANEGIPNKIFKEIRSRIPAGRRVV